jgi:hypothetical protein
MARRTKPVMTDLEDVELGEKTKIEVWTDRVLLIGDAHNPHSIRGVKDRISDLLNHPGKPFLSLTDVTISSLSKRRLWRGDFLWGLACDFTFYHQGRPHTALDNQTPDMV